MRLGNPEIDLQKAVYAYKSLQKQISQLPYSEQKHFSDILAKAKQTIDVYKEKIYGEPKPESNEIPELLLKELELIEKKEVKTKKYKLLTPEIEKLLQKKI